MSLIQHLHTFLSTFMYLKSYSPDEFYKKGVLKYSTEFTGTHQRWGLFCNKTAGWRPANSINTESETGAFL